MPTKITRCFILLFIILFGVFTAQNNSAGVSSVPSFTLKSGNKNKVIYAGELLSIYFLEKGQSGDSLYRRYSAAFAKLEGNSMQIRTAGYSENRLYKMHRDSSRYNIVDFGRDSLLSIPLSGITHLYYNRSTLKNIAFVAGAASVVSMLIVGPAVSFGSDGFNNQRFETIAAVSSGVLAASIIAGRGWGQKNYRLQTTNKKKRVWQVLPQN